MNSLLIVLGLFFGLFLGSFRFLFWFVFWFFSRLIACSAQLTHITLSTVPRLEHDHPGVDM